MDVKWQLLINKSRSCQINKDSKDILSLRDENLSHPSSKLPDELYFDSQQKIG